MLRRWCLLFGFFCFFGLLSVSAVMGEKIGYPTKPITLIVPWAAGGGSDQVARMIALLMEKELGKNVIVVNKPGGAGLIGFTAGATANPDGHTLVLGTTEIAMLHWQGVSNLSYRDFKHIALINTDPASIIVRADAPWGSLEDLQAAIKAKPGKITVSGTSKGGIWDLCRVGWLNALGLRENAAPFIPSLGAAPALRELLAGGVDLVTCSLAEAAPLIAENKVRPLAVMGETRDAYYKNIPTLKEKRINFANGSFRGLMVPLETSDEIVDILETTLEKVAHSQEFIDFMERNHFGAVYLDSSGFTRYLQEKDRMFGELMRKLGMAR